MDKNLKQIKPMECPVCHKFHFTKLYEFDRDELGLTPNTTRCRLCGWYYDLEQLKDPDLEHQANEISLNQYRAWYKEKIKTNKRWEYSREFAGEPEPHKCPVYDEYIFKDTLSADICPICGWEDYGYEANPDYKPWPAIMSFNERKKWFAEQRKKRTQNIKIVYSEGINNL